MNGHLKSSLGEEIAQTILQFKRFGPKKDTHLGIRQSEFMILSMLVHSPQFKSKGAKITELGVIMKVTPAAVTHMIATLASKEYVERDGDATDRRLVLVKPTEKGKALVETMVMRLVKRCEGMADFLGEKDSRELIRLMNKSFSYLSEEKE
jgi:DNA-binding MarR family transcriptional regulator